MESYTLAQSAFFDWLLKASFQTSVLVALVVCTRWLLARRLPPAWRYGLWLLVVIRLVVPRSPHSEWSIFNLQRLRPAPSKMRVFLVGERDASPALDPRMRALTPAARDPRAPRERGSLLAIASTSSEPRRPSAISGRAQTILEAAPPLDAHFTKTGQRPIHFWRPELAWNALPWCWLAGVLVLGSRFIYQNGRFLARLRYGWVLRDPESIALLKRCAQQMGVRLPLVVQTAQVQSPALYGLLRPRLLLPEAFQFSPAELRYVFLHELGHLKRRDTAVNWVMGVLQILHWFNPVLWFAFGRMRADRELACDALALSRARPGESQAYGETIIKILSGLNRPAVLPGLVGILEDQRQLQERIRMIARFQPASSWPLLAMICGGILAVVTLTDAQSEKAASRAPAASPPAQAGALPSSSAPAAVSDPSAPKGSEDASSVQDARLLIELGKLDEAEAKLTPVIHRSPDNTDALYYLSVIKETRYAQEAKQREASGKKALASEPRGQARSYGRQLIFQKLDQIVLDEILWDGLPLREVVRDLNEQARLRDPDKRGINFITNPKVAQPTPSATTVAENINDDVMVHLALRQVRLADVVEAVRKVAVSRTGTHVNYSVEDYGVVFVERPATEPEPLFTRTFHVDPQTVREGLENILRGQRVELNSGDKEGNTVNLFRHFFLTAGVSFPTNAVSDPSRMVVPSSGKALFYNDRTGLLLARATIDDLDIIEKAIQIVNLALPQVSIESRLVEIGVDSVKAVGFDWFLGNSPINSHGAGSLSAPDESPPLSSPATAILTDPQFRVLQRALEQRAVPRTLAKPRVTTLSGREVRVEVADVGFKLGALPRVMPDGNSIQLAVDFTSGAARAGDDQNTEIGGAAGTSRISTTATVWDGQTLVLGPFPSHDAKPDDRKGDGAKRLFLFVTPTILDAAGNRVHGAP
jgi:beta-lactamase regulating signal transducer with metallopeptidase domain/type II secretory pathway component GspD/PulD (secretin)